MRAEYEVTGYSSDDEIEYNISDNETCVNFSSESEKVRIINRRNVRHLCVNSARELEIVSCPNLETVCGNIHELSIKGCEKLREIKCDDLKSLRIEKCPEIKHIPRMERLQTLKVIDCYNLRDIELCPNLNVLHIYEGKLEKIRSFPQLKILYVEDVDTLKEIDYIGSLSDLWITGCHEFTTLPKLHNLKIFRCYKTNIRSLPRFPNIEEIYCNWCHSLVYIPYLHKLKNIDVSHCNNLEYFNVPDGTLIRSNFCPRLIGSRDCNIDITDVIKECKELKKIIFRIVLSNYLPKDLVKEILKRV